MKLHFPLISLGLVLFLGLLAPDVSAQAKRSMKDDDGRPDSLLCRPSIDTAFITITAYNLRSMSCPRQVRDTSCTLPANTPLFIVARYQGAIIGVTPILFSQFEPVIEGSCYIENRLPVLLNFPPPPPDSCGRREDYYGVAVTFSIDRALPSGSYITITCSNWFPRNLFAQDFSFTKEWRVCCPDFQAGLMQQPGRGQQADIRIESARSASVQWSLTGIATAREVRRGQAWVEPGQTQLPIDVSGLPPGLYLLRIQRGHEHRVLKLWVQ